jgi:CDP-paratose 2-epimerase
LLGLLEKQFAASRSGKERVINLGGGAANMMSLAQLSRWCAERFGPHQVGTDPRPRPFDVPWLTMDSRLALETWGWQPSIRLETILDEIARHAQAHPDWLEISAPR